MPKRRSEQRRRATAYHEAGHAVAAFIVQRGFRKISILEDEETLGRVLYQKWRKDFDPSVIDPERARRQIEKAIVTAYAGGEAERRHTGRRNARGSRSDDETAVDLACYVIADWEEELTAFLRWLRIRSRNIVTVAQNWRAVEALAAALLDKGEVNVSEARDIIIRAMRAS